MMWLARGSRESAALSVVTIVYPGGLEVGSAHRDLTPALFSRHSRGGQPRTPRHSTQRSPSV